MFDREEGFCEGLIKSRCFVALLSHGAIHHPSNPRQNFLQLTADSGCDNVLLEHRLALELRQRGLVEKIYPVMVGEVETTQAQSSAVVYKRYQRFDLAPVSSVVVKAVERKLAVSATLAIKTI